MNSIYELTMVDDVLMESFGKDQEFNEFSSVMNELTLMTDNILYFESVKDTTPNLRTVNANIKKNTWDTTRDVAHAYGNITTGNANLIKATWDIVMRSINLLSRALGYILTKISNIPKFILKTADRAMDIPGEIKAKIQGNITLYITAEDIETIYNKLLMQRLTEYSTLAAELARGQFFSTAFHKRIKDDSEKGHVIFGTNDMKLCRKMDNVYTHLQNTEFKPTIIQIKDDSIRNLYFGDSKSIKFTDNYGKHHETNYLGALEIYKDLESKKKDLQDIHKSIGEKIHLTEANQNYNKLNSPSKYRLNTTLSQITKVVTIIGNITKSIITDINTINKSINTMLEKSKINSKASSNVKADKANAKL